MTIRAKTIFLSVRAIGSRFGVDVWNQVAIVAAITTIVIGVLLGWLVSISGWWWLLVIPVVIALSVVVIVLGVLRLLLNYVNPAQTTEQKQAVKVFVGKIKFVQEFTATPKFIILFRVVRSVAAPSSEKYLEDIFESRNLKKDFETVVKTFQ